MKNKTVEEFADFLNKVWVDTNTTGLGHVEIYIGPPGWKSYSKTREKRTEC